MVKKAQRKPTLKLVAIILATIVLSVLLWCGVAKLFALTVDRYNAHLSRKLSLVALDYTKSRCMQQNYPDTICIELVAEANPPMGDFGGEWIVDVYFSGDRKKFSASMIVDIAIDGKTTVLHYGQDEPSQQN